MLGRELRRLAHHSAVYGIGGLVSRLLAVLLLPLYTHYLTRADYGRVETLTAASTVMVIVLRMGISSAFFRFYFDSHDEAHRVLVVRTCFWFTMVMATAGLVLGEIFAPQIADFLRLGPHADLVRAAAVGLWAQMNYEQLTSLFRVEERSLQFVYASLANIFVTVAATVVLVVVYHGHALGVVVGNFIGTLCVYLVLLGYRRYQLGLQFDRHLLRQMNRFGLPLVPSALALWAINFIDRIFVAAYKGPAEVGVYSVAVRISSAVVFLMIAFRTAWPAFAYSIDDDREAKRTYAFVLTYVVLVLSWVSLALGALAPWLVDLLTAPAFHRASEAVALLAFAGTAYAGYVVLAIGSGRARKTQLNWVITGAAALVNVGLNVALIPPYGMVGAAVSTLASYVALFVGMVWYAQHVYRVAYQWRRVLTAAGVAVALTAIARGLGAPLALSCLAVAAYPILLLPLGFYLPAERRRLANLRQRLQVLG
ncbi:MAG TPA: oligosaccharide flippase family protein [Gaiellaceae bacterium]